MKFYLRAALSINILEILLWPFGELLFLNKIDKADANPDRVRTELLQYEVQVESMGGDTLEVEVSSTGDDYAWNGWSWTGQVRATHEVDLARVVALDGTVRCHGCVSSLRIPADHHLARQRYAQ